MRRELLGGVLVVLTLAGCGPGGVDVVAQPGSGASSTAAARAGFVSEEALASTTASPARPTPTAKPSQVRPQASPTYPSGWPKRSGSSVVNGFSLVDRELLETGLGHAQVDMVDQEGCGKYSSFLIYAYFRKLAAYRGGPRTVTGTYHVDAAKPVPDSAFELQWEGGYQGSDDAWSGSGGPIPAVAGNEKGGTVTFTVRARYSNLETMADKTFTARYTWKLDTCPGHAPPKVTGRLLPAGPPS